MSLEEKRAELSRRNAAAVAGGGPERLQRQKDAGKLSARERLDLLLDEGLVRGARPPRGARLRRLRHGVATHPGRRVRDRLRQDRRPAGVRVRARLHRVRRVALAAERQEDLQANGPRDEDRGAGYRPQRLGRGAHPRGRRVPGGLRRDLPAQHARQRGRPADLGRHGSVRGRRGLLPGDHRLRLHGRPQQPYVRHRPGRHPHGDARGCEQGTARRRTHAQRDQRRGALPGSGRHALPADDPGARLVPAVEQPGRPAVRRHGRPCRSRRPRPRRGRAGGAGDPLRHQAHCHGGRRRRPLP